MSGFLLDTNVPDPRVNAWIFAQDCQRYHLQPLRGSRLIQRPLGSLSYGKS